MRNFKIKTGYDFEILLGAEYFLTIAQKAWDDEIIPHAVPMNNGEAQVGRPTEAKIVEGAEIDLTIVLESFSIFNDVNLHLSVNMEDDAVLLQFVRLDEDYETVIIALSGGEDGGGKEALEDIYNRITEGVNRRIPLNLGSDYSQPLIKKIIGDDEYISAIGLYLNNNSWIISEQNQANDDYEVVWEPGSRNANISLATSFLPAGNSFAIGLGVKTFTRIANHTWHSTRRETPNGFGHPIYRPEELEEWEKELAEWEAKDETERGDKPSPPNPIGEFKEFSLYPIINSEESLILLVVRARIFIDFWPDADITAQFKITPNIVDGELVPDTELISFDADTGFYGDFEAFIIGAITGGILIGPIAAIIGGCLGIIVQEVVESEAPKLFEGQVEEQGEEQVEGAFGLPDLRFVLFRMRNDEFYKTFTVAFHYFDNVEVDLSGMSLTGHLETEYEDHAVSTILVDKIRGGDDNSLIQLGYKITDRMNNSTCWLMVGDALERIQNNQLGAAILKPVATYKVTHPEIHEDATTIHDIKFSTGVDLRTSELISLFKGGIFTMPGYIFIEPNRPGVFGDIAHPYFRDIPKKGVLKCWFTIGKGFVDELDKKELPDGIVDQFHERGIPLDQHTSVRRLKKGETWKIVSSYSYGEYHIQNNEKKNELDVLISSEYLFSVGSRFIEVLDNGNINTTIETQFHRYGWILASEVEVKTEEAGNKWTVTESEGFGPYCIMNESGELKIYVIEKDVTDNLQNLESFTPDYIEE